MVLLALAPLACSPPRPDAPVPLPSLVELPYQINQSCACMEKSDCLILEERAGRSEARNLSCRWREAGEVADCTFEQRFVAYYDSSELAEPWQSRRLSVRLMTNGGWCAEP